MRFLKKILVVVLTTAAISTMYAQELSVRSSFLSSSGGIYPNVRADFPMTVNEVADNFESFFEETYNMKLQDANIGERGRVLFANDETFESLNAENADVYITVTDNGLGGSIMKFAVERSGDYVDKWYDPVAFQNMKNIVYGFIYNKFPQYYKEEISSTQAELQSLDEKADQIEVKIDDRREELDERFNEIYKLSKEITKLQKNLEKLENQMQSELDDLEKDNNRYLKLEK